VTLALLLGYSAALVLLGLWIGRRVESSGAFFVAGRQLGPLLLFATILAANIGAASTVGAAGLGYRDGVSAWWWVGSAGIGTLILGLWVGPRIWKLATEHGLYTVGDYLELRYGRETRATVAVLLWFGTLAILAGQLIAMAWVLNVVAGVPKVAGCLIGGVVMTAYFTAGGLLTSAWVNLVQLIVLFAGFALAVPLALANAGGWAAVAQATSAQPAAYHDFWGASGPWAYLALLAPAFIVSPGLVQKAYGGKSVGAVRLGITASAVMLMAFAALPPLLGMVARVYAPELANHELALPTVLTEALPPLIGVLALAAVFSAEISSADALLFMLSTSLSEDLYRRFVRPDASDGTVLRVARGAALAGGSLGIALAIVLPSVIDSIAIFYSLLSVSLFVPLVAGLYTRRPGTPEALAAIGVGVAATLAARVTGPGAGVLSPTTIGILATAVVFGGGMLVRRYGGKTEGR
jgi:SSS family solute:Na+ symporter